MSAYVVELYSFPPHTARTRGGIEYHCESTYYRIKKDSVEIVSSERTYQTPRIALSKALDALNSIIEDMPSEIRFTTMRAEEYPRNQEY